MFRAGLIGALIGLAIDGTATRAAALAGDATGTLAGCDIPGCLDSTYCTLTFTDPAKDRITISPAGTGDTFAATGITIRVILRNLQGQPFIGVPAEEIVLFHPELCICRGGNTADAPTDMNGMATFSGTIRGGGCVNSLFLAVDGVFICELPVKTNSWDALPASPCFVDAGDLAALSTRLGSQEGDANYSICSDFNEDTRIDAGDVASFASQLGAACP